MNKKTIIQIIIITILIIALGIMIYYTISSNTNNTINDNKQSQMQSGPETNGNSSSSSVEVSGEVEITDEQTKDNMYYETTSDGVNALLIQNGGSLVLTGSSVSKSGDTSDENSDFYGTNAGILVNNKGTLSISNSSINTNGSHANGLFVYGTGTATIKDSSITTSKNNSGGIMVAGGGTLTAENTDATTEGNSSAAIRSDRGGGTMLVTGGTYTTNGVGSPAIYSTADVTVKDATLISTKSEGAVVEGKNSITLNNVTLTDTNTTLNGNSETYKNIFLYQSMSGDADEGTSSFTAEDCTITTNKGDTIFVTNTSALIKLINNTIVNNDGDFLRIQAGKWGRSGSNGGEVTLNMSNQKVTGNIIVDSVSTLDMTMENGSYYEGTINADNSAKSITLKLDSSSKVKLTGDSYITSIDNTVTDYANIDFNGYTLYVNGTAIKM